MLESAGMDSGEKNDPDAASAEPQHYDTLIIGTGFSGLLAAIRLKKYHMNDFVLLERSAELGGTWRDNSYPGAEVDIPTGLYSVSLCPTPSGSVTRPRASYCNTPTTSSIDFNCANMPERSRP
jgi:cation diffusion facilitator CzcD-associated flavoprotein CzcO